jgi:hypothetical protein
MTAVKTLQVRIIDPQAERMLADLASKNYIEVDELEEIPNTMEEKIAEYQRQKGITLDKDDYDLVLGQLERGIEEPLCMRDVVAICKEARTERYAEEQKKRSAACR